MADGKVEIGIELDDSKAKSQASKTGSDIADGVEKGLKNASSSASSAAKNIESSLKSAGDSAKSAFSDVGDAAKNSFGDVGDAAKSASGDAASAFEGVGADVKGSLDDVGDAARSSFGDVGDAAHSAAGDASSAFESIPADAAGAFSDTASQAQAGFGDIGDSARSAASDAGSAFQSVPSTASGAFSDTASAAQSSFSGVVDAANSAADGVNSAFSGLGDSIKTHGGAALDVFGVQIPTSAAAAAAAVGIVVDKVVDFGKDSVEVGAEFDKSMSQVAATMGITKDDLGELTEFAKEMGATTSFSATQAAEALNYMALAGYDSNTAMEMLPTVLNLAAAGNMELATASDMVTDAQSALGLSLDETKQMVDQMAMASSKSNTSVEQLGSAFLTVGGTAKTLSGGTVELSSALGILADNGIKGAEGGTALRNIILSLSAPTDVAAKKMQELGLEVYDAEGNMRPLNDVFTDLNGILGEMDQKERTEVLNTLFNKVDLKSANALLANTGERFDQLTLFIDGAGVSAASFKENLSELGVSYDEMAAGIEKVGLTTEDLDQAIGLSNGNAELFVETLGEWVEAGISYDDIVQAMGVDMNDLQTALDGAAGSAQQMADTQLDNLAGDLTLLESATEGFQIAISDGLAPALRDIAQEGASSLGELKTAWDDAIANGDFTGAGEKIAEAITGMEDVIMSKIPEFAKAAVELLGGMAVGFAEALPGHIANFVSMMADLIPALIDALINVAIAIVDALPEIISSLIDAIPTIIGSMVEALITGVPALVAGFIELFAHLVAAIPEILAELIMALPEIVTGIANFFIENGPEMLDAAGKFFEGIPQALGEMIPKALADFGKFLGDVISKVGSWIVEMATNAAKAGQEFNEKVASFIRELPGKIAEFLSDIISKVVSWVSEFIENAKKAGSEFLKNVVDEVTKLPGKIAEFIGDIINKVKDFAKDFAERATKAGKDFFDNIVKEVTKIPEKMLNIGKNIVEGIWNGISGAAGWLWNQISGFANNIINGIKGFFGIASPSKIMRDEVGKMLSEGIVIGFEEDDPLGQIEGSLHSGMMAMQIDALSAAAGGMITTNNQTNNFYGDISSPDIIARNLRLQQRYGLAGSL